MAAARVRGFQGKDLGAVDTIAACAKHYAAYGFAEAGRDYNTVDISEQTLRNVVLPPFKAAADAGAATFMNSFNEIGGIPSTGNAHLQRDILKGEWGFQGFVVSDWGSIGEMIPHGFSADLKQAAQQAHHAPAATWTWSRAPTSATWRRSSRQGKVDVRARRRRGPAHPARQVRAGPVRRPVPLLGRGPREGRDADAREPRRRARRRAQVDRAAEERGRPAAPRQAGEVDRRDRPARERQGLAARQLARPGRRRTRPSRCSRASRRRPRRRRRSSTPRA